MLVGWLLPIAAAAQAVATYAPAPKEPPAGSAATTSAPAAHSGLPAGVVSLRAARAAGPGATVTVRGVVLNGRELGSVRYVQEHGGAGLALLGANIPGFAQLLAGDSVEARGVLKNDAGLLVLNPVFQLRRLGACPLVRARRVPAAQAAAALCEKNEGQLLCFTGVSRLSAATPGAETGALLSSETPYLLDGQPNAVVRIPAGSTGPEGLAEVLAPSGTPFDVVGIVSQAGQPGAGSTSGYFLLLRQRGDFRREGGLPRLLQEPVPTNISPTALTLTFETLNAGDTRVRYGTNAQLLRVGPQDPAITTHHSLTLDQLRPHTTYYVEVSSTNETGTFRATPVLMLTPGEK